MASRILIFNAIGIVIQYGLVILIYYFLFEVIKMVNRDLKSSNQPQQNPQQSGNAIVRQAHLLVIDSGSVKLEHSEYTLGETVSIGRSDSNDIIVNENIVSHEHACIADYKNGYWLSDLNSTNYTYLNGQRVTGQVLLKHGDLIKIGAVTFKFER